MSHTAIRAALGRPDQTQDTGDTVYWYYDRYYDTSAHTYQVIMINGRVDTVNRYGQRPRSRRPAGRAVTPR